MWKKEQEEWMKGRLEVMGGGEPSCMELYCTEKDSHRTVMQW